MWEMMLSGAYTGEDICRIASEEWNFRTRLLKKRGGGELAESTLYKMLTNIFYTGMFEYNGEIYEGKHEPMITMAEFDKVQQLLGRKGRPCPKRHVHAFTGWVLCGVCGCAITGEKKTKILRGTGESKTYGYYHCTGKKKGFKCPQLYVYTKDNNLDEQIDKALSKITILPEFYQWALEILKEDHQQETKNSQSVYESQNKRLEEIEKGLNRLLELVMEGVISKEDYSTKKEELKKEQLKLRSKHAETEQRSDNWRETIEKVFEFATYARYHFLNGDVYRKREILHCLGINPLLVDHEITFTLNKWLRPIEENYKILEEKYKRLEPNKITDLSIQNPLFSDLVPLWGG